MKKSDDPIVVEETFDKPVETVWKAITEVDQMRQWYFDNIPDFKPELGFQTRFNVHNQGRDFMHIWKVLEVSPPKMIKYTWRFEEYEGDGFVVFELFEQGKQTRLKLTCEVLEDFPDDIPEFKRESGVAGWKYFINQSLKAFLE